MFYNLTPHTGNHTAWAYWDNAFSNSELDFLQNEAKKSSQIGTTGSVNQEAVTDLRRSNIEWLELNENTEWVYRKLSEVASELNANCFRLQLSGFGEPLQLTNYNSENLGMYGWHCDFGAKVSRKLTLALQLSDPSEFEGGNLQLFTGGAPINIPKRRGLIAAFPSFVLHQVQPVTQGTRQSLVAWISGEPFR